MRFAVLFFVFGLMMDRVEIGGVTLLLFASHPVFGGVDALLAGGAGRQILDALT